MNKYLIAFAFLLFNSHDATSAQVNYCTATPEIWSDTAPLKFHHTNNLIQGSFRYDSNFIIKGKILDVNCVPVYNAVVNMWYSDTPDAGNGTHITDNNGNYYFVVRPITQNISINVNHQDFTPFETKIFFPGRYRANFQDTEYVKFKVAERKLITAKALPDNRSFNLDIVLNGLNRYRQY